MKKIILFTILFGIAATLCTPAMAKEGKNKEGILPAPSNVTADATADLDADGKPDSVCFAWDSVKGAVRYSLEVDVDADTNGDGFSDSVIEVLFDTAERTDGREPSDPGLCVPFDGFRSDLNGDDVLEPVFGPAIVKVKALKPGEGYGRPENDFSAAVDYTIPGGGTPDPVFPTQYQGSGPDPLGGL